MDKKKYWLRMEKGFFNDPLMKIMLKQTNGYEMAIFYEQLMLETIDTVGHLRFSETKAYNEVLLSTVFDKSLEFVKETIQFLKNYGAIEVLEDGTYFLTEVAKIIGKECDSAARVRNYRAKNKMEIEDKNESNNDSVTDVTGDYNYYNSDVTAEKNVCNGNVTKCNSDVTKCNEINNKEKNNKEENNKEKNILHITTITTITTINNFVTKNFKQELTDLEKAKIKEWLSLFEEKVIIYAFQKAVFNGVRKFSYVQGILNNWKKLDLTTFAKIQEYESKGKKHNENITPDVLKIDWLNL